MAGAEHAAGKTDPIHQFELNRILDLNLFGYDASFTNASLYMVLAAVLITGFLVWAMGQRAMVPSRVQSVAEMGHDFIAGIVRDSLGEEGMRFFPLVFALFSFVFVCNMLGMIPIPGAFTVTSQIIVTAALAMIVFLTVLIVGFAKHGMGFLRLFVPDGVPGYVLPLVVPIEVISFLSRPLSHSVRLFANMLAGHITMKVFAGFIVSLLGAGAFSILAPLPFLMVLGMTALEMLVAFLQAYVFTMLTCVYLNDALHPHH
jgi:F-type H+-transporting ATPase subunit a